MHIKDNLINFLYDKNYYIGLYDNSLYCFNYQELILLSDSKVVLKMPNWKLVIQGNNLLISKMCINEVLIKGKISNIGIIYE